MNVLVIGSGGREHALAWKAAQCEGVDTVFVAPGNAGTATEPGCENVAIAVDDFTALTDFAAARGVELTIVGPEVPLVAGITDFFAERGLACFGPSRLAAQLEGSKSFTKAFLDRYDIPTARYEAFTDLAAAQAYVRDQGVPIVIKADGLAAGKGVVVAHTVEQAMAALDDMLSGSAFGAAGSRVVIEEFLAGEEASFICISDGTNVVPFATSQDHKARDDGDRGPNTGGMGAYSPAPVVTPAIHDRVMAEVVGPTVRGMAEDGAPYVGFLYAGLMIMPDGTPKVIEFNCRFGDPEAQPVMMRLESDLVGLCRQALDGELAGVELEWDARVALGVVMAAGGYPEAYDKGDAISGVEAADADPDVKTFHAGTGLADGVLVTNGGRVLCVVGLGEDVAGARAVAYAAVDRIDWHNCYYRRDIGHRALGR
ncbi:MAG: phosphoribosylamine--glycine ligase [Pseudomonadales bacterium]|nr:phosphoribosylamine--glycine ligase [Pseudomonadales bacterium]NIX09719.1 phosphoribosylamine--glycine ligase [Pseudomonadales bacterium]